MNEEEFRKELKKLRQEMWDDIELIIDNTDRKVKRLTGLFEYESLNKT